MKKYKVAITDQADRDLRGIYEYITLELLLPENAKEQLNNFTKYEE